MPENLLGKVGHYNICPVEGRDCLGCYLNEDPLANQAVEEVRQRFAKEGKTVRFYPRNGVGLVFSSGDAKFVLDEGELKQL